MEGFALILGATVLATIVVAGFGMAVGYQLGLRDVAPIVVATQATEPVNQPMSLELCRDAAEIASQRSRGVLELANRYRETAPPDLLMSIDQLVALVTKLSQQLQQTGQVTRIQAPDVTVELPAITTAQDESSSSSGALSQEEMSTFTGHFNKCSSVKRRYPYDCYQTVFPMTDTQPDKLRAVRVRCHDLSVHGISFFLTDDPDFEQFVISLGNPARPAFMEAQVVHSKSVYMHEEMRILVGCRFIGRHVPQTPLPVSPEACNAAVL